MPHALLIFVDISIVAAAALSGYFWYAASRTKLRRVELAEELNSRDLNRIIVAFNRGQILNGRAAISTAAAGVLAVVRLSMDLAGPFGL